MRSPVPTGVARRYLGTATGRVLVLLANALAVAVGVEFYLPQLRTTPLHLWVLVADSPLALILFCASLLTLVGAGGPGGYPDTPFLRALNTLAFVSMVKYGLWTAVTLNLFFPYYYPAPWAYFGILGTHLVMAWEAFLLPHYARTDPRSLALALGWLLANDLADYGFGLHPRLQAPAVGPLPAITVALSGGAVLLAARWLDEDRPRRR
jgi:uncharacterized membrane protein YpjA